MLASVSIIALVPTALIGQALTMTRTFDEPVTWGFWVGVGLWLVPWLIAGLVVCARGAFRSMPYWRLPIRRVYEPVTTDLRETVN